VVLLSGDGSFQFGIQGLWTAARYEIPVLFVILNNQSYQSNRLGLVKLAGRAAKMKKYIGSYLGDPEIDHVAIARGYGVEGNRVTKPDEIQPALQQALQTVRSGKPFVLDFLIARRFQDADATWHEKFSVGQKTKSAQK
jgi:benzoylformate decarboxylase